MIYKAARFGAIAVGSLALAFAIYWGAAYVSARFPVEGRDQTSSASGSPVFVCADEVHADFAVPLQEALGEWGDLFPEVVNADNPQGSYVSVGWGDIVFFTEIPTWGHLRASHVMALFTGQNPVAIRVLAIREPKESSACKLIQLDQTGKHALLDYVRNSVAQPTSGAVKVLSRYEAYYIAKGRYSPFHTCNQWIANGLAEAGLPHAWFSPFSFGVTWPLQQ